MSKKRMRRYEALENMAPPSGGAMTMKGTTFEADAEAEWVKRAVRIGWMREVEEEEEGEGVQQRIGKVTETE